MKLNLHQICFILLVALVTLIVIAVCTIGLIESAPDVLLNQQNASQCYTQQVGNCIIK